MEAVKDELSTIKMSEQDSTSVIIPETGGSGDNQKLVGGAQQQELHLFEIYKAEGNALVKAEKFSEALQKYDEAWNHCRTDDDRAMILNNRGVVYEKLGDTEKAIEIFNEALGIKPEYARVLMRRGLVYKKLKRFEDAIQDISEAHALAVKNDQTISGLAEVQNELTTAYADAELERLTAGRQFEFPKDHFIRIYFRQFYCDPISRFWKGLDPYPMDENDNIEHDGFLAALVCMKNGKYTEVTKHCGDEINAGGKYRLEAHLLRGSLLFLLGETTESLSDFKAVYDDPEASTELKSCAHLKAALLENLWSTSEKAASHLASAEELWPENADVYYHAALCLVDKGEAIPALALLEKGQEICPDPRKFPLLHVMALTIRVSYDIVTSTPHEAISRLQQLESDGLFDVPECYEYYAQTLLLMQNKDEAFRFFDKAKEAAGDAGIVYDIKKVLAQQVLKLNAEATLADLMEYQDDPNFGNIALFHMGEMYFLLGKKEEAIGAMDMAVERSSCVYDMKVRILGKIDFLYNYCLVEKLKKYKVKLFDDAENERNNPLE